MEPYAIHVSANDSFEACYLVDLDGNAALSPAFRSTPFVIQERKLSYQLPSKVHNLDILLTEHGG
jgi:hypothetical protein